MNRSLVIVYKMAICYRNNKMFVFDEAIYTLLVSNDYNDISDSSTNHKES